MTNAERSALIPLGRAAGARAGAGGRRAAGRGGLALEGSLFVSQRLLFRNQPAGPAGGSTARRGFLPCGPRRALPTL